MTNKILFDTSLNERNLKRKEFILNKIKKYRDPKKSIILEVGIGNGRFGKLLGDAFKKYLGVDPDKEYVELAKKNIPDNARITYLEGSAEHIPFYEPVDIIFYANSWHFIKNLNSAIQEANRLLKEDGIIIILEPSEKTTNWKDPKLSKDSKQFDQKLLDKKIKALRAAKEKLEGQKLFKILEKSFVDFSESEFYLLCKRKDGAEEE